MITYNYNQQFSPPAPLVYVTVHSPDGKHHVEEFPAQIDPAADRTVIPLRLAEALALIPLGELPFGGLGGTIVRAKTYHVRIGIRGMPAIPLNAAAHHEEALVLLGRDVLNHYRILLDGPNLKAEIG